MQFALTKNPMKKFAALLLALLMATPHTFASFGDVPEDSWYRPYVEQLVSDGVFDEGDLFRPADPVNRAEFVKIVITAIDGLDGYDVPPTPTFDDVAEDAWYYAYVESAVQLEIVNGYTDAQGNLTGLFGPNDTVTRSAAAKILVGAFDIPPPPSPLSPFPPL